MAIRTSMTVILFSETTVEDVENKFSKCDVMIYPSEKECVPE